MPHVIAWACTSGSFLGDGGSGPAQAQVMSEHAGSIPATTTSLAMLAAARRLRAKDLFVITPYHREIGIKFVDLLQSNEFNVLGDAHAGLGSDYEVGELTTSDFESLASSIPESSCDAVIIPCTARPRPGPDEDSRRKTKSSDYNRKLGDHRPCSCHS